ncbi:MAG: hypothetical protein LC104_00645 [Bacteroidales bacterium]|nr:hypothetical protein [Bacteroidales bacterium]
MRNWAPLRPLQAAALLTRRLREAAHSPDVLLEFCFTDSLGHPLRQATVHRELQQFLTGHTRALIELPRDHGKSLQMCGRVLWELGHNPALRVKLVCATETLAAERSRFLREAIAANPRLRLVFPHLRPARPWTAEAFTIVRPADVIGPTVAAFGIGAGSTGARADLLICDDIVDVRSLYSPAERARVKDDFHNNLLNLLEPDGRFWGLSTPWHTDDLNAHLKKNPAFALFRRAVGPELQPVWPEKWPTSQLAARLREIGSAAFARGYRLLPITEGEVAIPAHWVQFWQEELPRERFEMVVLSVDPAVTAQSRADASALVVLGRVQGTNAIHCLEATARRISTPDLIAQIDTLDQFWSPDVILFESNAAFAGIRDLMQRHARFGAKVQGITQSRSKEARAAAFGVPVQNGRFRLRGGLTGVDARQRELFDEMTTFPFSTHDDLLDAAATGTEYLLARPVPRLWV